MWVIMSKELTKKAIDLLLTGATLLSEPCPYCSGVRVMKDGNALCVNCGREPKDKDMKDNTENNESNSTLEILETKLETLTKELEKESDHEKQQNILKSINSIVEILGKIKK